MAPAAYRRSRWRRSPRASRVCENGAMLRRTGVVVFAALAVVAGACSHGGTDSEKLSAIAPKLDPSTTATTATTAPPAVSPSLAAAASRIQRVRTLPGDGSPRPAKAPKTAAYHGPTPTRRIAIPRIGLDHLTYEGIDL